MNIKSDRLRKLETELQDLDQWLKLGLVPKKDLDKHHEEMRNLQLKVSEEKERLRMLQESGEFEELQIAKRPMRPAFQETQTTPDIDIGEEGLTEESLGVETEHFELEATSTGEEAAAEEVEEEVEQEEEEDPFSDRNRWRRGVLEDQDADQW